MVAHNYPRGMVAPWSCPPRPPPNSHDSVPASVPVPSHSNTPFFPALPIPGRGQGTMLMRAQAQPSARGQVA